MHNTKNNSRKAFKLILLEKQIDPEHLLICKVVGISENIIRDKDSVASGLIEGHD